MSLTQRERLIVHITQLANSKSHDKLDMRLGSAVKIIIENRCRSLPTEEIPEVFRDVLEELSASSLVYDEFEIH
mgnify:CR=1 FL=1